MKNYVYIATSLDGYIADEEEKLDWLPNPEKELNLGINFPEFINKIDAIVMGKNTFEMVCSFDTQWPYTKPVFVISNSLTEIPAKYKNKVILIKGPVEEITTNIHAQGYKNLYIDGGINIQNFLQKDLIDEIIITIIPVLLGAGKPLFSQLSKRLNFECVSTKTDKGIVQNHFKRIKKDDIKLY
jgi:dihydrofolate reductase